MPMIVNTGKKEDTVGDPPPTPPSPSAPEAGQLYFGRGKAKPSNPVHRGATRVASVIRRGTTVWGQAAGLGQGREGEGERSIQRSSNV